MSLWRRTPRAVCRVYDEDELFADGGRLDGAAPSHEPDPLEADAFEPAYEANDEHDLFAAAHAAGEARDSLAPSSHDSRSRRIGGVGLLAVVTAIVLGLIASSALHGSRALPAPSVALRGAPGAGARSRAGSGPGVTARVGDARAGREPAVTVRPARSAVRVASPRGPSRALSRGRSRRVESRAHVEPHANRAAPAGPTRAIPPASAPPPVAVASAGSFARRGSGGQAPPPPIEGEFGFER